MTDPSGAVKAYSEIIPSFSFAVQTAVDSIDPINYGVALAASGTPVQIIEVVGDVGVEGGGDNLPDQTLPNRVLAVPVPEIVPGLTSLPIRFPLSGTEPLITSLGLDCVDGATTEVATSGAVRFTKGHHSSLIDPTEKDDITAGTGFAELATGEMQKQVAAFAATGFAGSSAVTVSADTTTIVQACP